MSFRMLIGGYGIIAIVSTAIGAIGASHEPFVFLGMAAGPVCAIASYIILMLVYEAFRLLMLDELGEMMEWP